MSAAAGAGQPPVKDSAYYAEKIRRQRAKRRAKSGDSTDSDEEEEIKRLVKEKLKAKKRKAKGLPRKHAGLFKYLKERDARDAQLASAAGAAVPAEVHKLRFNAAKEKAKAEDSDSSD